MANRNITLTLAPKVMDILDNLYESGLVKSRTSVIEMALAEWIFNRGLYDAKLEDSETFK